MNYYFANAVLLYYFWLGVAITIEPLSIIFTGLMFLIIPSTTNIEIMPGMQESLEAQKECLKTTEWLRKNGYYN